jgi:hypothetical protein
MAITRIGNIASTIPDDSIANVKMANIVQSKNIIINGDMSVAQRSTSVASITGNGYHTVDRFQTVASSLGTWTQSQSTDVPTGQGFATSLKMDCTTADGSPSASDQLQIRQKIEGQNLQYLKKGTSSAESTTVSFWIKATKTGTNIVELFDNDNTRQICKSFTISSSDTWEKKTLTFAGDTTGAFGNDNGASLFLVFWLGCGSNFNSGTLSTSWESGSNANKAVGQVNHADSTSNDWYVTGIQLETGDTASEFEFLPVDVNLQRCMRYFQQFVDMSTLGVRTSTEIEGSFNFLIPMRASPSAAQSGVKVFYDLYGNEESQSSASIGFAVGSVDDTGCFLQFNNMSGLTQGRVMNPVSGISQFSAEL